MRLALLALVLGAAACDGTPAGTASDFEWTLPPGFPEPLVPEDNPMSIEKVELGRHLFYDKRLSGNGEQSCESCHFQAQAFTDEKRLPTGSTGNLVPRNSLSLTNVAYNATYTWANPVLETLEAQIRIPMFGEFPVELGITGKEDEVLERLAEDPVYTDLFTAAFPDALEPISYDNVVRGLASFLRTMISGDSPYDRFAQQGEPTLSASALRGMTLFFSERTECHHCHGGFNFTHSLRHEQSAFLDKPFHNTGLYNLDGQGAYPVDNTGIHDITGRPEDMGKFRAPTLRNIELTAPYAHDGSFDTLEELVDAYADGGRVIEDGPLAGDGRENPYRSAFVAGFALSDEERADLVEFLKSLTDPQFLVNPAFENPWP